MSTTIDQRVVEMRFDNRNFEQNVNQSLSTLQKLKQHLDFRGANKGLEDISKTAQKVNFNPLSASIDAVQTKFSYFQATVQHQLNRIVDSAVDAGKHLVSAFTIDPVKSGMQEYETQINAVQTILANTKSKGSTIDDVNAALNELNKYADMTIYNFTEMTRNIGTFTAAGVGLTESTQAIKGIANLAAVSGSTSQQASTAMYQLSQALAAGRVSLQDWNSVVNAGMGGEVFQEALKRTARVMGTGVDQAISKYGTFRESLTKGQWLTKEVLTETLAQLSGAYTEADLIAKGYSQEQAKEIYELSVTATDAATKVKTFTQLMDTLKEAAQSGWTQTWQLIIGDFEEAKELWTGVSDFFGGIIEKMSMARNAVVNMAMNNPLADMAKKLSGITEVGKKIENVADTVEKTVDKIQNLDEIVNKVIKGDYGHGQTRWDKLTQEGYDWAKVQNEVNKKLGSSIRHQEQSAQTTEKLTVKTKEQTKAVGELSDERLKEMGFTADEILIYRDLEKESAKTGKSIQELIDEMSNRTSGRDLLIDSVKNLKDVALSSAEAIKKAWYQVFPEKSLYSKANAIYGVIKAINTFTKNLSDMMNVEKGTETFDKLTRTFKGLFSAIHIVTTIFGGGFKLALKIIQGILNHFHLDILDVTATIGDVVYGVDQWMRKNDFLGKGIEFVITACETLVGNVIKFINSVRGVPKVGSSLNTIGDIFERISSSVYNFVKSFNWMPDIQATAKKFGNTLTTIFVDIANVLSKVETPIEEFMNKIKAMDKITLAGVLTALREFVADFVIQVSGISILKEKVCETLSNIGESVSNGLDNIGGIFGVFKDTVISYITQVVEFLRKYNILGSVLTVLVGIGIYKTANNLIKAFESMVRAVKGIGSAIEIITKPLKSLDKVFNTLSNVIDSYAFKTKSEAILNIAAAVAVLAASMFLMYNLDPAKMALAVAPLAGMCVILGILCALSNKVGGTGIAKISTTFLSMSASILILVVALKAMEKLNMEGIKERIGILAAIGIGLAVFARIATKKKGVDKGILSMVGIAVAMRIMINAFNKLDKQEFNHIGENIAVLASIAGTMIALSFATSKIDTKGTSGLLLMAVSLRVFVNAIKSILKIDFSEIQNGMGALIVVLYTFVGMIAASMLAGANAAKAGAMILMISVSMHLMVSAIKRMGRLSTHDIDKASGVIAGLLGIFILLTAVSSMAGKNAGKAGTMILSMSATFLALSVAMTIFSKLDPDGLSRAEHTVAVISACFAAMMIASGFSKESKANIISMCAAMGAMAVALGALTFVDPERLKSASLALSSVMAMFAAMTAATKLMKNTKKILPSLITMTIAVAIIGGMLYLVAQCPVQQALTAAGSIGTVLTALAASMLIVSKAGKMGKKSWISLGAMVGVVIVLSGIIFALSKLEVNDALTIASSLSVLLLSLSGACGILALVGKAGMGAIEGAAIAIAVVIMIGVFIGVIGYFSQKRSEMQDFLNSGIPILNSVGRGLGEFIGNFVDGISSGAMNVLPNIGTSLSEFAKNATPFFDKMGSLDASVATSAKNLAVALIALTGAELLDNILGFLTGSSDMSSFGEKLKGFAEGLVQFSDTVKDRIDKKAVKAATNCGMMITELADSIPNSGGFISKIIGDNDIEDFGNKLEYLGNGLAKFSEAVDGKIEPDSVKAAANCGMMITELASSVPNSGGFISKIIGDNDIEKFGDKLEYLGNGLTKFSEAVDGKISPDSVKAAANCGMMISKFASNIPNSGGFISEIIGDNDIGEFGDNLEALGKGLAKFSEAVDGKIEPDSVKAAANCGEMINAFTEDIPRGVSLIAGAFGAESDLEQFADNLYDLGYGIAEFAEQVTKAQVDTIKLNTTTNSINNLVSAINGIGDIKLEKLDNVQSSLNSISTNAVTEFVNDFRNAKPDLQYAISDFVQYAIDTLNNLGHKFETPGATHVYNYINNFKNKKDTALNYAKELVTSAYNGITSMNSRFKEAGVNACTGFVDGIRTKLQQGSVYSAGYAIGKEALDGSKKALDIHSPSRKMRKVGVNTVEGFIQGLKDKKLTVKKTVTKIFNEFVKMAFNATNVTKAAKHTITNYAKTYIYKTDKITKSTKAATKALSAFMKTTYKKSSYYDTDKQNLSEHVKSLSDLYKKERELRAKLTKAQNKKSKSKKSSSTSSEVKSIQKDIASVLKDIAKAKKQISKDQKTILKNAKKALKEYKKTIKDAVKEYTDYMDISVDKMDLFSDSTYTLKDTMYSIFSEATSGALNLSDAMSGLKDVIFDTTSELTKLSDMKEDLGVNFLEKFSSSVDDLNTSIEEAKSSYESISDEVKEAEEAKKEAEEELAKAKAKSESVNGRSQKYLDAITEAEQKLAEAEQNVTDKLKEQTDAREKLKELQNSDATEIRSFIDNLNSNTKGILEWKSNLAKIENSGLANGLYEYLEGLGISGSDTVATFAKMTKSDIQSINKEWAKYNELSNDLLIDNINNKAKDKTDWNTLLKKFEKLNINKDVKSTLLDEFKETGEESAETIRQILSMSDKQLKSFVKSYKTIIQLEKNTASNTMIENMKEQITDQNTWNTLIKKFKKLNINSTVKETLLKEFEEKGVESADTIRTILNMNEKQLKSFTKEYKNLLALEKQASKQSLIDSVKEKNQAMKDWSNLITKFSKLNINSKVKKALLEEFESQGLDSADTIEAILSMSDKELKSFASSYKELLELPEQLAEKTSKAISKTNKTTVEDNRKTVNTIIDTMNSAYKAQVTYQKNLKTLKSKLNNDDVYDYLVENLSSEEIAALTDASTKQLNEIKEIYGKAAKKSADEWLQEYSNKISDTSKWSKNMTALSKLNIPDKIKKALYSDFQERGAEGNEDLERILGFTPEQLEKFVKLYQKNNKTANSIANQITSGAAKVQDDVANNAYKTIQKFLKQVAKQSKVSFSKLEELSNSTKNTIKNALSKKEAAKISSAICDGLASGIKKKDKVVTAAVKSMAEKMLKTCKSALGIHSPSKEFAEIGKYADEGLANGLSNNSKLVSDASDTLSDELLVNMRSAIAMISYALSNDMDTSPTIRPILDMDELQAGIATISSLFGSETVSANLEMASSVANQMNASRNQNGSNTTTNNSYDQSTQTLNNTFNISGDNPREIANEVSRILQQQVNRRTAQWA